MIKNNKKQIIILSINIMIICLVLIISKTYSLKNKKLDNYIENKQGLISFTINGENSNLSFPSKGTGYIANSVTCKNGTTAEWDNEKWGLVNIVSNNKNKINCNVDFDYDAEAPTLSLSKETYIEDDFSGWTMETNASVEQEDGENVLVLGADGNYAKASSGVYDVNGDFWYPIFDGYTNNTEIQGVLWNSLYYDNNMVLVKSLEGYTGNGWATNLSLNKWKNDILWGDSYNSKTEGRALVNPRYGPNVKYLTLSFETGPSNTWSKPMIKIRNFRIYGEAIPNSFYDIKITSSDNEGVTLTKYASGSQTAEYFRTNGTVVTDSSIRVTTNGTYTVYVRDAVGNETIQTIEITDIV